MITRSLLIATAMASALGASAALAEDTVAAPPSTVTGPVYAHEDGIGHVGPQAATAKTKGDSSGAALINNTHAAAVSTGTAR